MLILENLKIKGKNSENWTEKDFEILPRHAYSWIPNKIKSSEELSDKLANDLKGKDLTQRRNVPYSRFKQDYCS